MKTSQYIAAIILGLCAGQALSADYATYSGQELFKRFCAPCHGASAMGDGPVAASLNVAVPNLHLLAVRRKGKFPDEKVAQIIDGRTTIGAHGSRTMPIWGEEFLRTEIGDPEAERATSDLIHKIVEYLRSIQTDNSGAPLH